MISRIPLLVTALLVCAGAALGQTHISGASPVPAAMAPPPASVRTAGREQALAELDNPDSLARIGALEDILTSNDAVLTDFALHKVFAGTDQQMKSIALRRILSDSRRQFIFEIKSCGSTNNWNQDTLNIICNNNLSSLSGAIPLLLRNMQENSGEFYIYSPYSENNGNGFAISPGKVQGIGLKFLVNLLRKIRDVDGRDCVGILKLSSAGMLIGTVSCGGLIFSGSIDLF